METTRILLAEDNAAHQQLLLLALVENQPLVNVVLVSTREAVVEAVSHQAFDCIVLDYNLPPATAPEIIAEIAEHQPSVPRIVISASEDQAVVIESMRQGVADFLPKQEATRRGMLWARIRRAIDAATASRVERREINRRLARLEKQANTDTLTGLLNRRALESAVLSPSRSDRRDALGVVMIDLDRFKSINDRFGHDVGDATLRRVAEIVRSHLEPTDIACRWGGEEIVVVKQTDSLPELWCWAEELRAGVQDRGAVDLPADEITASIGVEIVRRDEVPERGFAGADRAMYTAKSLGRNRVCTLAMAAAEDVARGLGSDTMITPRARLFGVIDALRATLGSTQIEHTGPHGVCVRDFARSLARVVRLSSESIDDLEIAAEFHDIGKLGLPEAVLAAPRRLSPAERLLVEQHARFGADLLELCGASATAAAAVRGHHHRFDTQETERSAGDGDDGGDAPTLSAIICACDALATMLQPRPYAMARPLPQALAELRAHRGSQFHPEVVDLLHFVPSPARRAA